ncbi:transcriptional regulator CynR [Gordonia malaquae]|uniref:transcriptional regulator CynR n=1 Tax=Gordonia malaquae TaxID=410332 RepID=UPI003016FB25
MELRHIRYLLAVADHGSFTRAAESLHISQPTLSHQVRQLEKALGVVLVDRSGRTVRLTDAGEAYAHHARLAMRDLAAGRRAVDDVVNLSRGHLRVAITPTFTAYLVGPLINRFHAAHPGLTLTIREATQDAIEAALVLDEIDAGIAFGAPHAPGIVASTLYTESLSLVTNADHPLASSSVTLELRTAMRHPLVLLTDDFATRRQLDAHFDAHDAPPRVTVEVSSVSALIEAVRSAPLLTVLPYAITLNHPELVRIPVTPQLPTRDVTLLRRDSDYQSSASRAFDAIVRELVAEHRGA